MKKNTPKGPPWIWRAKDGREIPVSEMTDQHLKHAIAFLERAYSSLCLQWSAMAECYAMTAPDGASMAAESEAEALMQEADEQEHIEGEYPIYAVLVAEVERRQRPQRFEQINKEALLDRIQDYLGNGGLFNPEMMDPEKVRDLLLAIRQHLAK